MQLDIVLIGYEEGENLGLRYIASYLESNNVKVKILSYNPEHKIKILDSLLIYKPKIVGYSLIFQRMISDFNDLITLLRKNNITSHFTMGGHVPSIEPLKVLKLIKPLDSIIRCEGEYTLLELFRNIESPQKWEKIEGLAYKKNGEIIINKYRNLISDLDKLPFPVRLSKPYMHRGIGLSTIISSRGCFYNCCFCSIQKFYRESKGKKRRRRSPLNVVKEIRYLNDLYNVQIFIFEDDDFPLKGINNIQWIEEFVKELHDKELHDKIAFRISVRVDEIDHSALKLLMNVGLLSVYVGIESGNNESLLKFNKKYTVQDIKSTLESFNHLKLPYEFGFMILHPYCTFETIENDIVFLRELANSDLTNIHFTKMIPYAGTNIEASLIQEGRLKGDLINPDYDYTDERIDYFQLFLTLAFHRRNFDKSGLLENLRYAKFDQIILSRFYHYDDANTQEIITNLIRLSNLVFIELTSKALAYMKKRTLSNIIQEWNFMEELIQEAHKADYELNIKLNKTLEKIDVSTANILF